MVRNCSQHFGGWVTRDEVQVEATDAAIDKLVYELYGLTGEEIAIVEGNAK